MNPGSGLGVGGLQPEGREGGHWPTGLRQRLQLCLQFPLPPSFPPPLSGSRQEGLPLTPAPAQEGGPGGGAGSLGRKKTWAHTLITPHTACTGPEPVWKRMCTGRRCQKEKVFLPHTPVRATGPSEAPGWVLQGWPCSLARSLSPALINPADRFSARRTPSPRGPGKGEGSPCPRCGWRVWGS